VAGRKAFRAVTSFVAEVDGVQRFVRPGELVASTDPLVKRHPELFTEEIPVEQATAAPGEKRGRRRDPRRDRFLSHARAAARRRRDPPQVSADIHAAAVKDRPAA
jgi:hypothetical protein